VIWGRTPPYGSGTPCQCLVETLGLGYPCQGGADEVSRLNAPPCWAFGRPNGVLLNLGASGSAEGLVEAACYSGRVKLINVALNAGRDMVSLLNLCMTAMTIATKTPYSCNDNCKGNQSAMIIARFLKPVTYHHK
jgi:hypothetical protein